MIGRKIGYALNSKVINITADSVGSAITNKLSPIAPLIKTITFDNGKEFAEQSRIDKALQETTYSADPFAG